MKEATSLETTDLIMYWTVSVPLTTELGNEWPQVHPQEIHRESSACLTQQKLQIDFIVNSAVQNGHSLSSSHFISRDDRCPLWLLLLTWVTLLIKWTNLKIFSKRCIQQTDKLVTTELSSCSNWQPPSTPSLWVFVCPFPLRSLMRSFQSLSFPLFWEYTKGSFSSKPNFQMKEYLGAQKLSKHLGLKNFKRFLNY